MSAFGNGSNSNGSFWYGNSTNFPGFLYKKNVGVGARRSTKMGPGGNITCNSPTYLYNKYKPGQGGVGASNIANRRAKNRLATICNGKNNCFPCYMTLGQYSNYTHNPNGFIPCPGIYLSNTPSPGPSPGPFPEPSPTPCPPLTLSDIARFDGEVWSLNRDTTILACQTLEIPLGQQLVIRFVLINNGTINIVGNMSNETTNGIFTNNGTINNNSSVYSYNTDGATFTNNGLFYNNNKSGGFFYNANGSTFLNQVGSRIINTSDFYNTFNSTFINYGTIDNNNNGVFFNANSSTMYNNLGGIINNNSNGGVVGNNATFYNDGGIINNNFSYSLFDNSSGGVLINTNNGIINNFNNSVFQNPSSTIYNINGGTITNNSAYTPSGTINSPTIYAGCGVGILNGSNPFIATGSACPP